MSATSIRFDRRTRESTHCCGIAVVLLWSRCHCTRHRCRMYWPMWCFCLTTWQQLHEVEAHTCSTVSHCDLHHQTPASLRAWKTKTQTVLRRDVLQNAAWLIALESECRESPHVHRFGRVQSSEELSDAIPPHRHSSRQPPDGSPISHSCSRTRVGVQRGPQQHKWRRRDSWISRAEPGRQGQPRAQVQASEGLRGAYLSERSSLRL